MIPALILIPFVIAVFSGKVAQKNQSEEKDREENKKKDSPVVAEAIKPKAKSLEQSGVSLTPLNPETQADDTVNKNAYVSDVGK